MQPNSEPGKRLLSGLRHAASSITPRCSPGTA